LPKIEEIRLKNVEKNKINEIAKKFREKYKDKLI
jgi:predicted DNA-binding protein (UPF0278 family)